MNSCALFTLLHDVWDFRYFLQPWERGMLGSQFGPSWYGWGSVTHLAEGLLLLLESCQLSWLPPGLWLQRTYFPYHFPSSLICLLIFLSCWPFYSKSGRHEAKRKPSISPWALRSPASLPSSLLHQRLLRVVYIMFGFAILCSRSILCLIEMSGLSF